MNQNNWHDIYTQLSPKLLGICRRYIKDIATAEDIVQDSFIIAIQKENDLKNKNALNGWLSRIVINNAINYLNNKQLNNKTDVKIIDFIDETSDMNATQLDPKTAILAADFSQNELLEAIDCLSENHKSVFNLYIIDQFSHAEISKLLQISVGTSKSCLSRARKNIQAFLAEKLDAKKIEEHKKRRVLFLLFLGFGNQMFAQKFTKSFDTFEVQPRQALDFSRTVANPTILFPLKSLNSAFYLSIAGVAVVASIWLIFTFSKNEIPLPVNNQSIEEEIVVLEKTVDSPKVENVALPKIPNKNTSTVSKISAVPSKKIATPVEPEDTVTKVETKKVVVIKKQIIKKDTVYVQK